MSARNIVVRSLTSDDWQNRDCVVTEVMRRDDAVTTVTRRCTYHVEVRVTLPSLQDSDLARALRELAARHRRRATVILVSDVADPYSIDEQRKALAAASQRHRLGL